MVTFEEVKKAYDELTEIIGNCKTVDDIQNLRRFGIDVSINFDDIQVSELEDMSQIENLRVDEYDVLDHISFLDWQSGEPAIWFDIWEEDIFEDIIEDVQITTAKSELEKYYSSMNYIKNAVEFINDYIANIDNSDEFLKLFDRCSATYNFITDVLMYEEHKTFISLDIVMEWGMDDARDYLFNIVWQVCGVPYDTAEEMLGYKS